MVSRSAGGYPDPIDGTRFPSRALYRWRTPETRSEEAPRGRFSRPGERCGMELRRYTSHCGRCSSVYGALSRPDRQHQVPEPRPLPLEDTGNSFGRGLA